MDVTDSFAYGARDAWLAGGEPGCGGDTTPPEPPIIELPGGGDVVYTSRPAIVGTAEPNATVEVFEAGVHLGTGVATDGGHFLAAPNSDLTVGGHSVWATATDAAGNVSDASAARQFAVAALAGIMPVLGDRGRLRIVEIAEFPDPFEPGLAQNRLRVMAEVRREAGLGGGSPNHRFLAVVQRTIKEPVSGGSLKTTVGFTQIANEAGSGGEDVPVTVVDYWCGTDDAGDPVERGRSYRYDLSVRIVRQYVGPGRGPRCSRDETVIAEGPGAPACLLDSVALPDLGVVRLAEAEPGSEPMRPYCYPDLLMMTDAARAYAPADTPHFTLAPTRALGRIWGGGFRIDPSAVGCDRPTLEDRALCLLSATTAFGIDDPAAQLTHLRTEPTGPGYSLLRFRQQLQGRPVEGGDVLLTLSPEGALTRVVSKFLPDIRVLNSAHGVFDEDFAAFPSDPATASVIAELERLGEPISPSPAVPWDQELIVPDHEHGTQQARLAMGAVVMPSGRPDRPYYAVADVATGDLLRLAQGWGELPAAVVRTQVVPPAWSPEHVCATDVDCSSEPLATQCLAEDGQGDFCSARCTDGVTCDPSMWCFSDGRSGIVLLRRICVDRENLSWQRSTCRRR
jgi:hypothetical protein